MKRIIDTNVNVSALAGALRKKGVGTVIRYYCQSKAKRLSAAEAKALAEAGLSLAVVYEDGGGTRKVDRFRVGRLRKGDWVLTENQADASVDHLLAALMPRSFAGGAAIALPNLGKVPVDYAVEESAHRYCGTPGPASDKRIEEYHASTGHTEYDDETAWCSSFVNWCVEQAGLVGTDDPGARSWHDQHWGTDVTDSPERGDIAVFSRSGANAEAWSGHVGFFMGFQGERLQILGGNQGGCVTVDTFPRDGTKGRYHFKLLSIRRPSLV